MSFRPQGDEPTFLYELEREGRDLELIEYLQESDDPLIRFRTAEILGDFRVRAGEQSVERISRALVGAIKRDDHDGVRAAAIDSLYLRDEPRLESLIEELAASGVHDPPAWTGVDSVAAWLDAEAPEFRLVAASAIGFDGTDADLEALTTVFNDPDIRVRREAVRAAGNLDAPDAVGPLAERLRDPNEGVRRAAASSLASIGTAPALEALVPATGDADESVRRIAIGELGRFASARPIPILVEAVGDPADSVARTATRSLLVLLASTRTDGQQDVHPLVPKRLRESGLTETIVPHLLTIVGANPSDRIRREALWLLAQVADDAPADDRDRVIDAFCRSLGADVDDVAIVATSALVDLGGQDVVRRLRAFVDASPGDRARSRAERVLERIETALRAPADATTEAGIEFTFVESPADYSSPRSDAGGVARTDGERREPGSQDPPSGRDRRE